MSEVTAEARNDAIATGEELLAYLPGTHGHNDQCPVCSGPVKVVAMALLAYVFEPCSCDEADYEHLVETLYHRACLAPIECREFRPYFVRARRAHPAYYTETCQACGRLEAGHRSSEPQP